VQEIRQKFWIVKTKNKQKRLNWAGKWIKNYDAKRINIKTQSIG
jgi:hypothetical protein